MLAICKFMPKFDSHLWNEFMAQNQNSTAIRNCVKTHVLLKTTNKGVKINARKMSHEHNNKDLSGIRQLLPCMRECVYKVHNSTKCKNNNIKEDFQSAHLPYKVGAQGALQ